MEQKCLPPSRQEILATCPGLHSSPTQVRAWIEKYLIYRGLEPASSKKFFLRGLELHRASYTALIAAFKQHCGILDWEAEILAYDVYTIVEVGLALSGLSAGQDSVSLVRAIFQIYVERLFGHEFYCNLMWWKKPNTDFTGHLNCVLCWLGFVTIHPILLLLSTLILGFFMST
ncbi:hypothetical protein GGR55DRAFT_636104 [Xylaria sp. FL0064]|nr:hypothetical protein GGR55DRAFT_636104 [Xylaria sp. FL0064]